MCVYYLLLYYKFITPPVFVLYNNIPVCECAVSAAIVSRRESVLYISALFALAVPVTRAFAWAAASYVYYVRADRSGSSRTGRGGGVGERARFVHSRGPRACGNP